MRFWPLLSWTLVVVAVVLPWTSFQSHSHWARVVWVPFATPPPITMRDVVVNVLLYVPFGYLHARLRRGSRQVLLSSVFWAASLSLATEWTQVYSHARFPSATDVLLNVIGAATGVVLSLVSRQRRDKA